MLRPLLLASACVCALAPVRPAFAQDAEATVLEDIVVTGSQVTLTAPYAGGQLARGGRVGVFGALNVMDTPFATTNYTEEVIRQQQSRSVADVLQNDPTVRLSKGFGNFQELYFIRGFPVFSDDLTYNGLYGILPRQFVAAEFLERVEVFRGVTAFLNGASPGGSLGGAINLTPKRATDDPISRLTAGLEGGDEVYLAADLGRRFGLDQTYGGRLNLVRRDGEAGVDGQDRGLSAVGLGVDRRGDRARFSADIGWQDQRIDAPRPTVTPAGAVPRPPSADGNFAQPWTFTAEEQLFGVARGEFDLTPDVSAWAAFGGRRGEEANVLANPTAQPDGRITAYRFDNTREDTVWAADAGVRAEVTTGRVDHRLVASVSQVQLKFENAFAFSDFAGFPMGTLYDPVVVAPPPATAFIGGDLSDPGVTERIDNRSIALADMASLLDGRLLLTAGARYQEIETRAYAYGTGAAAGAYDGDAITPVFAAVYRPIDEISLYANYAEGLIPGQVAPGTVNGAPVTNAGEVLAPFRGDQAEVGFKYDVGRFGATVSLFRTTQPSAFVEDAVFAANGEQVNEGLEITAFGEPRDGLRLIGGLTWLDARIERAASPALEGRRPIGTPEFQASLNVEWDVAPLPGLTLEGRVVHTGEQPVDALNTIDLEAWTRLDAGVRYATTVSDRPITLRARVENLADEDQWTAVGGFPGANYLSLGAPRTLRLSVSADF